MSLINREALLSYADLWASCGEHYTAEDVIMMIKTAPTVDVAPVRHAKWGVNVGMNFFKERNCPVCKRRIESNFWNYCPNCGAMMDLEG